MGKTREHGESWTFADSSSIWNGLTSNCSRDWHWGHNNTCCERVNRITECRGDKEGQGLVPTLPVFKGDCCPKEKKRKPGTAEFFPLGLFPLLSMHYPGCCKLIINKKKKTTSIPATCFLSIACGTEYLTHTFEHQASCDTSLCMLLASLQVSLMPDVSLNMTQEIMLVFAVCRYFIFPGDVPGSGFKYKKTDFLWTEIMFFRMVCPLGVCYHN